MLQVWGIIMTSVRRIPCRRSNKSAPNFENDSFALSLLFFFSPPSLSIGLSIVALFNPITLHVQSSLGFGPPWNTNSNETSTKTSSNKTRRKTRNAKLRLPGMCNKQHGGRKNTSKIEGNDQQLPMRWFKYTLSGVIEGRTVIETPGSIKPKQTTRLG